MSEAHVRTHVSYSLWDSTAVSGGMHGIRSAVVIVATNCNAIELYITME